MINFGLRLRVRSDAVITDLPFDIFLLVQNDMPFDVSISCGDKSPDPQC